jgi:hypothetical protein
MPYIRAANVFDVAAAALVLWRYLAVSGLCSTISLSIMSST